MIIDNPKLEIIVENLRVNLNNISEKELNDEDKELYQSLKSSLDNVITPSEYEKFLENNQ